MATTQKPKPTIDPRSFARQGATHRQEQHLPRTQGHQASSEEAGSEIKEQASKGRGGRPRIFEGETVRLNLFIPEETSKRIRHLAIEQGISPSQLVDEWARKAELLSAIARGDQAFQEGRFIDQEEAERRLSRWS
jgi:predicted transcriptional regulator